MYYRLKAKRGVENTLDILFALTAILVLTLLLPYSLLYYFNLPLTLIYIVTPVLLVTSLVLYKVLINRKPTVRKAKPDNKKKKAIIASTATIAGTALYVLLSITVLNIQSYPTVGGEWVVEFNTTGTADLSVTAINGTYWDKDLIFQGIYCGDSLQDSMFVGDSYVVRDYSCFETGREVSKVLSKGKHTLHFQFGNEEDYAYNFASGCDWLINASGGNYTWSNGTFDGTDEEETKLMLNRTIENISEFTTNTSYSTQSRGVWVNNTHVFVLQGDSNNATQDEWVVIYNLTGGEIASYNVSAFMSEPYGIVCNHTTWTVDTCWLLNYRNLYAGVNNGLVVKVNSSFDNQSQWQLTGTSMTDITLNNSYLYMTSYVDKIWRTALDGSGGTSSSTSAWSNTPYGIITADGTYFWVADDGDDKIYLIDSSYAKVNEYGISTWNTQVRGIATNSTSHGFPTYIWIAHNNNDKIVKLRIQYDTSANRYYTAHEFDSGSNYACNNVTVTFTSNGQTIDLWFKDGSGSWVEKNTGITSGTNYDLSGSQQNCTIRLELSGTVSATPIVDKIEAWKALGCTTPTNDLYINSDTTLCSGTYYLNDSGADGILIINSSNVSLDCGGAILIGNTTGYGVYWWNPTHENVTIQNCDIRNYTIGIKGRTGDAAEVDSVRDVLIQDSSFSHNRNHIYIERSDYGLYENLTFSYGGNGSQGCSVDCGLQLKEGDYNVITNNTFDNEWQGVRIVTYCDYNNITDNNFTDAVTGYYQTMVEALSSNNRVVNNYYEDVYTAIEAYGGCNYTTITGNKIINATETGIFLRDSVNGGDEHSLVESNLINLSKYAINVDDADHSRILSNTINGSGTSNGYGITVTDADNVTVAHNTVYDYVTGTAYGMKLRKCVNTAFNNNTLIHNRHGVKLRWETSGNLFENSTIIDSTNDAIYAEDNAAGYTLRNLNTSNSVNQDVYMQTNATVIGINWSDYTTSFADALSIFFYSVYLTFECDTDATFNLTVKWDNSSGDSLHTFTGGNLSKEDMFYFNQSNSTFDNKSNKYIEIKGLNDSQVYNVTKWGVFYDNFSTDASGTGGFLVNVTDSVKFVVTNTGVSGAWTISISGEAVNDTAIYINESVRLNCSVTGTNSISVVKFYLGLANGTSYNISAVNGSGNEWYHICDDVDVYCKTYLAGSYNWTNVWANDSANNVNTSTPNLQFNVSAAPSEEDAVLTIINNIIKYYW